MRGFLKLKIFDIIFYLLSDEEGHISEITREQFTITFDGPAMGKHEIEASLLANSLVALRSLAERAGRVQYGREADVIMKVKGGFKGGSFGIDLIIDLAKNNPELSGAGIASTIYGAIKLYKWVKGKAFVTENESDDSIKVINADGQANIFQNCVVNLALHNATKGDMDRLTRPLGAPGVTSIEMSDVDSEEPLVVNKEEHGYFSTDGREVIRDETTQFTLEIINPNLRGEPTGWVFFDGDATFKAQVEDNDFLSAVKNGGYSFTSGDMIDVQVRTVQERKQRLTTTRTIEEVMAFLPANSNLIR